MSVAHEANVKMVLLSRLTMVNTDLFIILVGYIEYVAFTQECLSSRAICSPSLLEISRVFFFFPIVLWSTTVLISRWASLFFSLFLPYYSFAQE